MSDPDLLVNPAWHALTGRQRSLAVCGERGGRYGRRISPFAALADDGDLNDLNEFVESGYGVIFMCANPIDSVAGWKSARHGY